MLAVFGFSIVSAAAFQDCVVLSQTHADGGPWLCCRSRSERGLLEQQQTFWNSLPAPPPWVHS